jgi:hypothetical protein
MHVNVESETKSQMYTVQQDAAIYERKENTNLPSDD